MDNQNKATADERRIKVPSLLSERIRQVTDEGHYATLMAALGRRIGEIQSLLPEDKIETSFLILEAAIEAGRVQSLNETTREH